MKTPLSQSFVRYLTTGISAFIVEYSSFAILYSVFANFLVIDNAVSFLLGLITSFTFNRIWVFKDGDKAYSKRSGHQIAVYVTLATINLILTILIVYFLKLIGVDPKAGKIIAMIATSAWNFILFKLFIFNHKPTK